MYKVMKEGSEMNQTVAGHESELHGARTPAPAGGWEEGMEAW